MYITNLLVSALAATMAVATSIPKSFGPIQGYPVGTSCLNDKQAEFLVEQFRQILANPDRAKANATAQALIANDYVESSDSINILDNKALGAPSFSNKEAFIQSALAAPPLPGFQTIKVFHDCNNILWQWRLTGLGLDKYPVKGFNSIYVPNPKCGIIQRTDLEFNSIAWGTNIGWTCTPPPPRPQ